MNGLFEVTYTTMMLIERECINIQVVIYISIYGKANI
jgi:hypothetical protein